MGQLRQSAGSWRVSGVAVPAAADAAGCEGTDWLGAPALLETDVACGCTDEAVSGAAAILLVGLFLFQQNESETIASTNKSIPVLEKKINTDSLCSDNPESPAKTYFCYMRQNSIKNNQLTTYSQQLTN